MGTLYVDYKNGADTNDGSSGSPLKTLSHCISSHANNGDTILLRGGNAEDEAYHDSNLTISKTTLTIANDVGHNPVMRPTLIYSTWVQTGGATSVYESAYTPNVCYGVWHSGTKLTSVVDVAACDAAENSYFFDNANDKMYVHISGGGAPASVEILSQYEFTLKFTGSGFTLHGVTFQRWVQGVSASSAAGSGTIQSCIWSNQGSGYGGMAIALAGSTYTVKSCAIIAASYCINLTATGSDLTVQDCILNGIGSDSGSGIYLQGGTSTKIERCMISGFHDGIQCTAGDFEADRNVILDCYHSGIITVGATASSTLHHNVINWTAAITGNASGIVCEDSAVVNAYHNTVANNNLCSGSGNLFYVPGGTAVFYNNIMLNGKNDLIYVSGVTEDYNCSFGCAVTKISGGHNVLDNPQFVNPGNYDFRLLPTSPLIDAGKLVTGINEGFRGGAPDIGAHEYVRPLRHGRR